jgi:hypothetical protein
MKPKETTYRLIGLDAVALVAAIACAGTLNAAPQPSGVPGNTTPPILSPGKTQIAEYDLVLSSFSWSPQGRGQKFDFCIVNKGRFGSKPATVAVGVVDALPFPYTAVGSAAFPGLSPEQTKCGSVTYDFHRTPYVVSSPDRCLHVKAKVHNDDYPSEKYKQDNEGWVRLKPLQGIGC